MDRFISRQVVSLSCLALLLVAAAYAADTTTGGGRSNCTTQKCGNISVPYPFGLEPGCYYPGFNLTCNHSYSPPRLFLGDGTVQVLEISIPNGTVRINSSRIEFSSTNKEVVNRTLGVGDPYFVSSFNKIVLAGCNVRVDLRGSSNTDLRSSDNTLISSCTSICPSGYLFYQRGRDGRPCIGVGCCEAYISFPKGPLHCNIQIQHLQGEYYRPTGEVYLVDEGFDYEMRLGPDRESNPKELPALLEWYILSNLSTNCPIYKDQSTSAPECRSAKSYCRSSSNDRFPQAAPGYRCLCSDGYAGNPYVPDGCQDIDECKDPTYSCYGECKNTIGSFNCTCPPGFEGDAPEQDGCKDIDECQRPEAYPCYGMCINRPGDFICHCPYGTDGDPTRKGGCIPVQHYLSAQDLGLRIGLGVGSGTILLLLIVAAPFISRKIKLRKKKKMREAFFRQNRGLLLQRLMSKKADIGERMIMTLRDLEKATDNFNKTREVGGGGHGIVYKGILDLHVVAIKKSRIIVKREIDDFINEVAILSQINHRNVVKLLGCCLEAEVPLLVYEFISNGSLDNHLHVDGPISLPWDDRLRIALEVARALTNLHSATTIPIFHRDIKACNILLDDNLTAKVSDFGASRYIPIDQTEVTTVVQGTIGYLDPMYYYTGHLTDKSDVFSFGVLLIELLTRKKPIYRTDDGDSLVSHFASLLQEDRLIEIIDPKVTTEGNAEVQEVALLAAMCTKLNGQDRPTMREVEMRLESLQVKKEIVLHNTKSTSHDVSQTGSYHMPATRGNEEASRQYSMEEEMLLSERYPR